MLSRARATGLKEFSDPFPDLHNHGDARLIGPTLEGAGLYPDFNGDLRLLDAPAWIAGDACGLLRRGSDGHDQWALRCIYSAEGDCLHGYYVQRVLETFRNCA